MLVDLIELYIDGKKLPREAWRLQPRIRGELMVTRYFSWYGHDRAPAGAYLKPFGLVEELHKVRIAHLDERNLVLFGDQRTKGRMLDQAWWCRFAKHQHAGRESGERGSPRPPVAAVETLPSESQAARADVRQLVPE